MTRSVTSSPRTALLTGATSGIGQWTALGLAKAGFRVIAVGRDEARARQLVEWVRAKHGSAEIETTLADLSLMAEVRRLASEVKSRAPRLDLLVNNAGLLRNHRIETREGHELTLAVNHLAPFLLTRELLPLLASTARIVNVGSSSSDKAQIDPNDLEWKARPWSMYKAYGQSKLALMLTSFEFARRLGHTPTVNVVHPGTVATRIGDLGGGLGVAWALLKPVLLTPAAGAQTTLHVATDRRLDLDDLRDTLKPFCSNTGHPSIDPELMIRMLLVGYCTGIRSERRLCEEVHLNLAYRWFCRLGLNGKVPDYSTFSKNRHGRFRESNILRHQFETVVARCMAEGLVSAEGFAVDASLIPADVNKHHSVPSNDWKPEEIMEEAGRATREYLATLAAVGDR